MYIQLIVIGTHVAYCKHANIVAGVLANEEAVDLKSKLQTLPGMGGVLVYRYGLCHSYLWNIEWLQVGGDRPTLQLDTTNLKVGVSLLSDFQLIVLSVSFKVSFIFLLKCKFFQQVV